VITLGAFVQVTVMCDRLKICVSCISIHLLCYFRNCKYWDYIIR